ncbi:unnamed protein product [Macrosiphum euphorbiae]|uniref:DRBM domain-containing protein n=1 Tax=Macrosiphum euphorbiae TaxID=13131 RepID=A0AAV0WGM4_9HEMI|nr:unnamed protein product [Macrosiphum euphorbiae]
MSNSATCVTPKTTTPMKNHIQQQSMLLHDAPSQSTGPKPVVETQILTASVAQTSPVKDLENKRINLEDEKSNKKMSEVKWPVRQKSSKKERKKRLNARMRRLVSPKSPLTVVSELFNDVPIHFEDQSINNVTGYTVTLQVDGQVYTGKHISKIRAKQKACERFLRNMLAKKISEESEKKEESPIGIDMKDEKNGTLPNPKVPQEDFPWLHFASLAMHNLIHCWKLQPVPKIINLQEEQPKLKIGAMRKFPEDPKNCNPVQIINQMKPGVKFIETIISLNPPSAFRVKCEIDNIPFTGLGSSKKAAKRECCIAAIKYFWQFDFHAI